MTVLERFAQNTSGGDFVIGDIHGCFDQLQDAFETNSPTHDEQYHIGRVLKVVERCARALLESSSLQGRTMRAHHAFKS